MWGLLRTSQAGRDVHWLRESRDRGEGLLILPAEPWLPHPSGACFVRLIYKCSCEMVFNKKRHFQQHFYQNVSKSQAGVFKCPECPLLFLQKPELMQHVKVRCPGRSFGGSADQASGQGFDSALFIPRVPMVFPGTWMSYPASRLQRTHPLVALFLELPLSPQPQA